MSDFTIGSIIAGAFTILVALIQRGSNKHSREHNTTREILMDVRDTVEEISDQLDEHINDDEAHKHSAS